MERELERTKEREPAMYDRVLESSAQLLRDEKKAASAMPHVIKYDSIPWTQGAQAFHKHLIRGPALDMPYNTGIRSMVALEQILAPAGKSGRHRHYFEAMFYILEGEGYEVHDGKRYDWRQGDIACVPTYTIHQHFNTDPVKNARLFYIIPGIFRFMGISETEQIELHINYRVPDGATPIYGDGHRFTGYRTGDGKEFFFGLDEPLQKLMDDMKKVSEEVGEAKDDYAQAMKLLAEENEWRGEGPRGGRPPELAWQNTRMGKIKYVVHPRLGSALRTIEAYFQELPPGGRSGKHMHVGEELHLILEGKGHDVHDGARWDWEKEDMVAIPINTVHQHFNDDPKKPALFLSVTSRLFNFVGHGGVQHLEDAPR